MSDYTAPFYMDIRGCARCGKFHQHLLVTHLEKPIICKEAHARWDWFAMCPETNAPILVTVDGGT